ncbi:MAG: ribose transport system substrate-binding protein [Pseudonocardiales bacterium]|nr:ribose transport system substrate-binding protein [Pseudonocardiales bacterium]
MGGLGWWSGRATVLVAVATTGVVLAACSSGSSTSTQAGGTSAGGTGAAGGSSACGTVADTAPGGTADLSSLPADVKAGYNGYFTAVNKSLYATFKPKPGPYTIGYSDSFSANSWRANALSRLKKDVDTYKGAGLTTGLTATNSNLDNNLQIQQISSMINQHVSAIIAIPNSPTAFNGVIKQAYDAGIPFITVASHVTSPYAINVDGNYLLTGELVAAGIGKMINGKGNVLVVNGINGAPASAALSDGYAAAFKLCPDIKVTGAVEGQWSEATAKTVTLQYLSTHPAPLAAVVNSGGMTSAIMQAVQQTGHQLMPIGDANPDKGSLVALKDKLSDKYVASTIPPEQTIDAALRVAIATLQGQGPKFDAIVANPPQVTGAAALNGWVQSDWTASSADQAPAPPNVSFLPSSQLGSFFTTPKDLPALP